MCILGLEGRPGQASHQGTIPDSAPFQPRSLGPADLRSSMRPSWAGAPPPTPAPPWPAPSSPPTRTLPAHAHAGQLRLRRRLESGSRGRPLTREAWPRRPGGQSRWAPPRAACSTPCRVQQATAHRRQPAAWARGSRMAVRRRRAGKWGGVQGAGPGGGVDGRCGMWRRGGGSCRGRCRYC